MEIDGIITSEEKYYYSWFKNVSWRKLGDLVRKVNEVLSDIKTINIIETNNIINVATRFVARKLDLRSSGNRRRKKKKRTLLEEKNKTIINEIRKHINILEQNMRDEKLNRMKSSEIKEK